MTGSGCVTSWPYIYTHTNCKPNSFHRLVLCICHGVVAVTVAKDLQKICKRLARDFKKLPRTSLCTGFNRRYESNKLVLITVSRILLVLVQGKKWCRQVEPEQDAPTTAEIAVTVLTRVHSQLVTVQKRSLTLASRLWKHRCSESDQTADRGGRLSK